MKASYRNPLLPVTILMGVPDRPSYEPPICLLPQGVPITLRVILRHESQLGQPDFQRSGKANRNFFILILLLVASKCKTYLCHQ